MPADRFALPSTDVQPLRDPRQVERDMIPSGATKKRMAFWYGSRKAFRRAMRAARQETNDAQP